MNLFQSFFYLLVLTLILYFENVNAVNAKKQDDKCLMPMEPGPCRMSLNRFYYNAQKDECEEFKFGGCRGNDNKFGFKQTCEEACKKSTTSGGTADILKPKQLNPNTLKTLTSVIKETPSTTTTTTLKPKISQTTVKSRTTSPPATRSTTTQKSKSQL